MRIRTRVVTQSGRVLRPVGAVFDVDDQTDDAIAFVETTDDVDALEKFLRHERILSPVRSGVEAAIVARLNGLQGNTE